MAHQFIRLEAQSGTWAQFLEDWQQQCAEFREDFAPYEIEPIGVVRDLAEGPRRDDAAAFAFHDGEIFAAMCQVNVTQLPGYVGDVLRVRMLYLSPYYEFGEYSVEKYSELVADVFWKIFEMSRLHMPARHIKFHLRSPADRQFFVSLGNALDASGVFESVAVRGAWLYLTKN
jgi:hypothetical protein